jgi:hypothetical protein
MNTDDLIRDLAQDVRPVGRHAMARRVAAGIGAGAIGGLLIVAAWLGVRSDLAAAATSFPFLMKFVYASLLAAGALFLGLRLMRPDGSAARLWILAAPAAVLAAIAVYQLAQSPQQWPSLVFGHTAAVCPLRIFVISIPVFAGLMWAARGFAPTQLRLAGAVAGLAAGAIAALLYALYCGEVSAAFVLLWYTLGMLAAAALGALLGPSLLRW